VVTRVDGTGCVLLVEPLHPARYRL